MEFKKKKENCKVLCFYLPQFHETPENNKWWGDGYTEWTAVKNAVPYFKGHKQPNEPLNDNYYDLADEKAETWKWQSRLAQKYGIDGFVIYHYWFAGRKVLERPVEILLRHPEIDIKYSLCWDNNEWRRTWFGNKEEILIPQNYGMQDVWKQHFDDLLPFFKDSRYIKIDNKPIFHIYACNKIPCLQEMVAYWNELAKEQGFKGIYLIAGDYFQRGKNRAIDAYYNFEPNRIQVQSKYSKMLTRVIDLKNGIRKRIQYVTHKSKIDIRNAAFLYKLLANENSNTAYKTFKGIWIRYDDTPRRQEKGTCYRKGTVARFEDTLYKLLIQSDREKLEYIYINAWNEWGEGAYLEPDKENGYQYLQAVYNAINRAQKTGLGEKI